MGRDRAGAGNMKVGAVIPCKDKSRGVPGKNFRPMCGKPMWQWTLDAARNAGIFETIVISSNGGLDANGPDGQLVYKNEEVIKDIHNSSLDDLCKLYAEEYTHIDIWCLLQPTSPLRTAQDIKGAFKCLDYHDSVVSVESVGDKYWVRLNDKNKALYDPNNRLMRQNSSTNVLFYENGAIYFFTREVIMNGSRISENVGLYEMPSERSVQIDTEYNWKFCEFMLRERLDNENCYYSRCRD